MIKSKDTNEEALNQNDADSVTDSETMNTNSDGTGFDEDNQFHNNINININDKDLKEKIDEKEDEIDKKNKEIESLMDMLKRRQADFENYKKRMMKNQEDYRKLAIKDLALDIININDDLIRAIDAASNISDDQSIQETRKAFAEGVLMISKRIEETLKNYEIEEIDSLDNEFDPNYNEAIEIELSDEVDKDMITYVHQKGFKLGDYVLRTAKVKVTKPKPIGSTNTSEEHSIAEH